MSKNVLLTISLLVSNRPDTVKKSLDSIRPLMEQVSSELILVDTGCGEQVRSIIEEYTDQIVEFEWCNDFSKARNAGLSRAKGKWFMFLDDDEWFEDVTEFIEFFNSGEYKKYGMGAYIQRNYLNQGSAVYTDLLVGRMVRLEPDIKFVYSIHENFSRVPGLVKKFSAFVHHYGYVYKTKEEARAHSERNVSLLLKEHEKHPNNMKHTLQLAQEYNALDQHEKSLEMSLDGIAWSKKGKVEDDFCLNSLFSNEIDCYVQLKRFDDAIEKGEKYLKEEKLDPLVRAVISGDLAISYSEKGKDEKCMEHTGLYWKVMKKYMANEEAYMEYITIMTNECFEPRNRSIVLGNGVRAASHLGEAELAWKWFEGMEWKSAAIFISNDMIRAILSRMPDADREERAYYVKMCDTILERRELEGYVISTIREVCGWHGSSAEAVAGFAGVNSDHWFFKLADLMEALAWTDEAKTQVQAEAGEESDDGEGERHAASGKEPVDFDAVKAEELALDVLRQMNESMPLMKSCDMLMRMEHAGIERRKVLDKVPFYIWKNGVAYLFSTNGSSDLDWWNEQFEDVFSSEELKMLLWRALYSTHRTKRVAEVGAGTETGTVGGDEDAVIRDIEGGFREYAQCLMKLCERIYLPEVIETMPDVLPSEYQAAYHLRDVLEEMRQGKYDRAVKSLREVRKFLPGMDNVMRRYLTWLNKKMEQQKQEAQQAAGEFQVLARQIKARVRTFIDAGQYQAALGIVKQIKTLLPGDADVERWLEELKQYEA